MTGRELITYILENHLEDEPVFQNGTFIGYMSDKKFAEMLGVGLATVQVWALLGQIKGIVLIGDSIYIPIKCVDEFKTTREQNQGSDSKCETN